MAKDLEDKRKHFKWNTDEETMGKLDARAREHSRTKTSMLNALVKVAYDATFPKKATASRSR